MLSLFPDSSPPVSQWKFHPAMLPHETKRDHPNLPERPSISRDSTLSSKYAAAVSLLSRFLLVALQNFNWIINDKNCSYLSQNDHHSFIRVTAAFHQLSCRFLYRKGRLGEDFRSSIPDCCIYPQFSRSFCSAFPRKVKLHGRKGLTDNCSLGEECRNYIPRRVPQDSPYSVMSFQPAIHIDRRSQNRSMELHCKRTVL